MTVINMLGLKDAGIAVGDEQSSNRLRKYNVSQKVVPLGENCVYGGSGSTDGLKNVYRASNRMVNEHGERQKLTVGDISGIVSQNIIDLKRSDVGRNLMANLGISIEDALSGTHNGRPLDSEVKSRIASIIQGSDERMGMAVLVGGITPKGFEIYTQDSGGYLAQSSTPYVSVGSGSDESNKVLSQFVIGLPRDQRLQIDPKLGIAKVIEATNASTQINVGVGGIPSIAYVTRNGILQPGEDETKLATELVASLPTGILSKEFVYNSTFDLITNGASFSQTHQAMREVAGDKIGDLELFLRGYRISKD